MTNSNRVSKFKDLREGLKDEVGINRELINEVKVEEVEDDFLSFVNKDSERNDINDTLTDGKTFEQLHQERRIEIEKTFNSVNANHDNEEQYNTRMDILSRIRNPEKEVIEAKEEPINEASKKKLTLMERLASMSPKEDVDKLEEILQEEEIKNKTINKNEVTSSLKVTASMIEDNEIIIKSNDESNVVISREAKREINKSTKSNNVLNYIIIILMGVFAVLFGVIIYQFVTSVL